MDHGQSEQLLVNIADAAVQSSVRQSVLRPATPRRTAGRAGRRIDDALNNSGIKNLSWWKNAWRVYRPDQLEALAAELGVGTGPPR